MKYESVQQAREALKKLEQTQAAYNHALGGAVSGRHHRRAQRHLGGTGQDHGGHVSDHL